MFTRYKGIDIPQNYSGSRFKSEPPQTEMKTHKPTSIYTPTKTSISPTFERAVSQGYQAAFERTPSEETRDNVSEFEGLSEQNQSRTRERFDGDEYDYESIESEGLDGIVEGEEFEWDGVEGERYEGEKPRGERGALGGNDEIGNERDSAHKNGGIFNELSPFINKFFKNISSEDLFLLSLVVLLFSEGNEEANDLIIPLLCLFLYH